jgi:hypothetical protein
LHFLFFAELADFFFLHFFLAISAVGALAMLRGAIATAPASSPIATSADAPRILISRGS